MNAVLLARLQFAFTVSVHIIFPAFTIGLSAFIATLLILWQRTGRDHFHRLARFWTKVFAVSFAMGVVSGIPMSYEFGSNWMLGLTVLGGAEAHPAAPAGGSRGARCARHGPVGFLDPVRQ